MKNDGDIGKLRILPIIVPNNNKCTINVAFLSAEIFKKFPAGANLQSPLAAFGLRRLKMFAYWAPWKY